MTLNVSNGSSTGGDVSFQKKGPGDDSYQYFESSELVSTSNSFWNITYDKGSASSGSYDFRVNDTDGEWVTLENVTLDAKKPSISSESPEGLTSDNEHTVSYDVSDPHSGVNESTEYIGVEYSNGTTVKDSNSTSVDVEDLGDGEYTVNYEVEDNVGNLADGSWTFTVDTSYDGDDSPDMPSDEIHLLQDDDDMDFDVYLDENNENTDITVTCYTDDGDEIDSMTKDVNEDNEEFTCDIDGDDYAATSHDIYVEMCDEAGNCVESDSQSYVFDADAPEFVEDPSVVVGVYNDDFTVDFGALDDASGLDEVEYFFEAGTDEGDGYSVDIDDATDEFTVDTSDLEDGQHTLYVRLKDRAGRWSDTETLNFEYDPDANPEVSLEVPDNVTVTAGESANFSITVENTGNLLVSGAGLTVEGAGMDTTEVVDDLYPGDTTDISFEVSPGEEHIGTPEVTASAENPSASKSFNIRVKASEDQQSEIESDLSEQESKLESLRENVSVLKEKGLSEDLSGQLDSDFSSFEQEIENARSAVDDGNYYKAQSILEDINSSYGQASNTYEDVKQTYQKNRRNKIILFVVLGFFGIAGAAGLFLWRSDEFDFDYENAYNGIVDSDIDVGGLDLGGLKSRLSVILEGKDEAEEFEWQGFE